MDDKQNKKVDEVEEQADAAAQPAISNVPEEAVKAENVKEESLEASGEEPSSAKATDGQGNEPTKEPKKELGEAKSPEGTKQPSPSDAGKWYIVHTYSGHENKVSKSLHQRIESMGFENRIFDIIVPTRETVKVSQGKKETVKEKIFPGYVLVKMVLDDESWLLVRTTQGVTAFIGAGNKPTPISDKEVEAIQKFMATEEPLYKTSFTIGEAVKIVDGPFSDFLGTIDNIDEAKGKLKVLVSIFGRETPVELDFLQVTKL
jgi:transcription termination/antitermination protein NusG